MDILTTDQASNASHIATLAIIADAFSRQAEACELAGSTGRTQGRCSYLHEEASGDACHSITHLNGAILRCQPTDMDDIVSMLVALSDTIDGATNAAVEADRAQAQRDLETATFAMLAFLAKDGRTRMERETIHIARERAAIRASKLEG